MGSSQSAPVQQVVNTFEQFRYHPATVFKFFVIIGIIAGVTIFALASWSHKKALDVSAPLCAPKVLRKATQQDAYIEYFQTKSPPPTSPAPVPSFRISTKTLEQAMGIFHPPCNASLHHPAMVPPVPTYPHQPPLILHGNHGMVMKPNHVHNPITQ